MMALEAPRLNISMSFLDACGTECPAADTVPSNRIIQGSLQDAEKIAEISQNVDIVTVEIEHVNVAALAQLEQNGIKVRPSSRVLFIIQDKFKQKLHFAQHSIPLPSFMECSSVAAIREAVGVSHL
jgi:phosphoribosylaminoimidazole carboxylase